MKGGRKGGRKEGRKGGRKYGKKGGRKERTKKGRNEKAKERCKEAIKEVRKRDKQTKKNGINNKRGQGHLMISYMMLNNKSGQCGTNYS